MLCISYSFAIMYHNMQKLNKAALKFLALSMSMVALFTFKNVDMEWRIGIGIFKV